MEKKQLKAVVNQHRDCWNITIESMGKYRHLNFGSIFHCYVSLQECILGGIWEVVFGMNDELMDG